MTRWQALRERATRVWRRLRGGELTPGRLGGSVGVGLFIGVQPVYGLHLPLCVAIGLPLRLDLVATYLAANVSIAPLAPLLLVAEVELGSLLITGQHAAFTVEQARAIGFGGYVAQAFVGSLTLGTVLALAGGLVTWAVSRRFRRRTPLSDAIARTVARYATAPRADRAYVEVKLTSDPVVGLLAEHRELVPRFVGNEDHQRRGAALQTSGFSDGSADRTQLGAALPAARFDGNATLGRVVDAGAGRGQLGLLLVELGRCSSLTAFDWDARKVEVGRAAAGAEARVERAALTDWSWDEADTVLFVDVLHYLDRQEQDDVLRRAARALAPGGRLLVRDVDASQGWRSFVTTLAERIGTGCGYNRGARLCFRPAAELEAVLTSCGLDCDVRPASEGTPLANVLIDARRSRSSASR